MIDGKAMSNVEAFVRAVVTAAICDVDAGISEYADRNTGDRLIGRLDLQTHRSFPRNGDGKYARSLYTAAYWLYKTENPNGEEV